MVTACGVLARGQSGLPLGGLSEGQPAADFRLPLFNGGEVRLDDWKGKKAVVVNFWFPSCPPCREEMPEFQKVWEQVQGQDVEFLGVFVPQGLDTEEDARNLVSELGLTYDFATDRGAKVALDYKLQFFPTTYFIGKDGRVFRVEISTLDAPALSRLVSDLLRG
ncbi:MAG: TlpA family protein disulfide reductase [SAR202 cluster bacterium]|nr:TlpA family protein disulfide reductase [SAR202 cluster bacterium]